MWYRKFGVRLCLCDSTVSVANNLRIHINVMALWYASTTDDKKKKKQTACSMPMATSEMCWVPNRCQCEHENENRYFPSRKSDDMKHSRAKWKRKYRNFIWTIPKEEDNNLGFRIFEQRYRTVVRIIATQIRPAIDWDVVEKDSYASQLLFCKIWLTVCLRKRTYYYIIHETCTNKYLNIWIFFCWLRYKDTAKEFDEFKRVSKVFRVVPRFGCCYFIENFGIV